MKRRFRYLVLLSLLSWLASLGSARAENFILSIDNEDDSYFVGLLDAALKAADGTHTLRTHTYDRSVPQSRVLRTLLANEAPVNVTFTGHSIQREQLLRQIDIPLLRGLLGYRLFAIRAENADKFTRLRSLSDLARSITVGSGTSWPDTVILKNAGFKIEMGTVDNLWSMLHRGRFLALPMGMHEIQDELRRFKRREPTTAVMVEQSVMIRYHFDYFYYVAPNDTHRAAIIEQGLKRLYETGEFMRIFNEDPSIKAALVEAAKYKRTIVNLENPLNSDRVNAIPERFWHQIEN